MTLVGAGNSLVSAMLRTSYLDNASFEFSRVASGPCAALMPGAGFWKNVGKVSGLSAAGRVGRRDGLKSLVSPQWCATVSGMFIEEVRRGSPRQAYTHASGVYRCSWPGSWFGQFKRRGRSFYVATGRCHDEVALRVARKRAWVDHHLARGVPIDVLTQVDRAVVVDRCVLQTECQSPDSVS